MDPNLSMTNQATNPVNNLSPNQSIDNQVTNPITNQVTNPITNQTPPVIIQQPIGYIKTIQRRGNTYMIRDSLPSEEDPAQISGTDQMIQDLYLETIKLSSVANRKAGLFKILYVLCSFLMLIGGAVVGILSIGDDYIVSVLGFVITGIQTFLTTFAIERRGVLLKDVSNKLRKVSRQVRTLQNIDMTPKDRMRKLEEYYTEVDELDLSMFDNKITTVSVLSGTNIMVGPNSHNRRGDSDINSSGDDNLYETARAISRSRMKVQPNQKNILPVTDSDVHDKILPEMSKQ